MQQVIARCGFRCDLCPAFVKNNTSAADRLAVAAGWSKYFRLKLKPESIRCYGCLEVRGRGFDLPPKTCAIQRCVTKRKLDNCAGCAEYPCKELDRRMKGVEKVIDRFRNKIPEREFDRFLAPYDARTTLNRLRKRKSL
jgi:hypothetical protein